MDYLIRALLEKLRVFLVAEPIEALLESRV